MAACTCIIKSKEYAHRVAISPDGQQIAVADKSVLLLNARTGGLLFDTALRYGGCLAFSPSQQPLLLAVGDRDGIIWVWDCSSNLCVAKLNNHRCFVDRIAFSPDGRLLASAAWCTVQLWRTDDWDAPATVLMDHRYTHVWGVSFSCDGHLLATCAGTVHLWNTPTSIPIIHNNIGGRHVVFSPVDSTLLAYVGGCHYPVLARVRGNNAITVEHELRGHTDTVHRMSFSPCGQELASCSQDYTVRVWSVVSGACLHTLQNHWIVSDVAFFPNGKQLAACSSSVKIWTLCAWSDRTHYLFGASLKAAVFTLMCVRARLKQEQKQQLPMELWLMVFEQLAVCHRL